MFEDDDIDDALPFQAPPRSLTSPTITGSFVLGGVLSVSIEPTWRDPQPDSTYHKWLRDQETAEVAATHTVVVADVGHTLYAEVVGQHVLGSTGVVSNGLTYDFNADQPDTKILLYGDNDVIGDPVDFWQSDDPGLGPLYSAAGAARPIVGAFGGRASVDADGVDDLMASDLYGNIGLVNTQIWCGFSFKFLVPATDTHSGVDLWMSHLIFGDANAFLGVCLYKDGSDTKIAAFYQPSSGPMLFTASRVLTLDNIYWCEVELASGGNFALRINDDFESSIVTGGLPISAGVLGSNLRLFQGGRPKTAGVAIGDLCAMAVVPDADHLAAARRYFAARRTGVVTP